MTKQIHNVSQGSQEWLNLRLTKRPASLIGAVMGLSPYTTRNEVLKIYATGIPAEINDFVQQFVFAEGHRVEPLAREIIENTIGEDLSPMVYSKGALSASTDGINFAETIGFECKQWNDDLAKLVIDGVVPDSHMPQVQQSLLVTGADEWYFTVSDGTEEKTVYTVVKPNQSWFNRIEAAWSQFETDLAEYAPIVHNAKPEGEAVKELPALFVHAYGEITTNNMQDFGDALAKSLANSRAIVLVTDQDFANANKAAKQYRDQIEKLEAVKKSMLEQTTSIGEAARMIDEWKEDLRVTALQLEKDVKREDLAKKESIIMGAKYAYADYLIELRKEVLPINLAVEQPIFANAIARKRDYNSMQNAVDTMLANAKIEAAEAANTIKAKLTYLDDVAKDYKFLFNDLQSIIYMTKDHYEMTVRVRIESHKKAEADKLEAQRLQIEAEAKRKAEAEQAAKLEAEREKIRQEEQAKIAEEARLETLRIAEEKLKAEANKPTPEKLRAQAKEMSIAAEYADRNEDRNREKNAALDLMKKADELEKELQETSLYDDSFEVIPTVIEDPLPSTRSTRQRIIWAVVGEFDISYKEAEKLIFDEFYFNEEMEEDEMEAV